MNLDPQGKPEVLWFDVDDDVVLEKIRSNVCTVMPVRFSFGGLSYAFLVTEDGLDGSSSGQTWRLSLLRDTTVLKIVYSNSAFHKNPEEASVVGVTTPPTN